jgi:hypothetical protein
MKNSKAIVTLAVGHNYLKAWKRLCKENWQKYADKYGYDLICLETPLDDSERAKQRSVAWQKCLILSQDFSANYERIVWVDSDILINSFIAPCIVKDVPIDKVGAVEESSAPTPQLYKQALERKFDYWGSAAIVNYTPQEFYKNYGLPPIFDKIVHTGVMVFSPHHHRHILEKVYFDYEEKRDGKWNYEMRPLSWELLKADAVHWIDYRFNAIWTDFKFLNYPFLIDNSPTKSRIVRKLNSMLGVFSISKKLAKNCATVTFVNNFFLHFAGCSADMKLVNLKATLWRDCKLK